MSAPATGAGRQFDPGPSPAGITLRRLVEYPDTDASGHFHNGSVIRWIEAAEAVLHARLEMADITFPHSPRVHLEVDFRERLYFLDDIDIDLRVTDVGHRSVRYQFEVRRGAAVAVSGLFVATYLPRGADRAQPWPAAVRRALREGGDRSRP